MRIVIVAMADVLALVAALVAVYEYRGLRRYNSFTLPFTDKLIAGGALPRERRAAILREDRISHWLGLGLSVLMWLMLSKFLAGLSGLVAFPIGAAVALFLIKPEPGETPANRAAYYRAHKSDIDPMKYSAMFQNEA